MSAPVWLDQGFVWGIVIGGIVGAAVNYVFYRMGEQPKRLAWDIMDYAGINYPVTVAQLKRNALRGGPNMARAETPASVDLRYRLRIGNTGKVPIRADDFPEPILIWPTLGSKFVGTPIIAYSHPGVAMDLAIDATDERVKIKPLLLDRHEWIDLSFVVRGKIMTSINVDARFAGQAEPLKSADSHLPLQMGLAIFIVSLVSLAMFTIRSVGGLWVQGSAGLAFISFMWLWQQAAGPGRKYRWRKSTTYSIDRPA